MSVADVKVRQHDYLQGFVGRVAGVLKSKLGLVSSLLRYTFAYLCQTTYEYSGGIAAYVTSVYLYLQGTQPTFFLSRRVGQFAIICIGIEVITESVTLLNMLHLVCEKQLKSSVATESPDNIDSSEDFPTSIAIPGPPPGSLITTSSPLEMDHLGSQVNSMAFNLIRDNE
ncbi:hypothetical protein BASA62_005226 [Batrachochytrium salamandrivorans]|nr:hypothetical protein BASA62_005226 [Batrachochytrium salamandrivorans]